MALANINSVASFRIWEARHTPGIINYLFYLLTSIVYNSTFSHYVAHLKKGGIWYIFNDEKVAVSQNPPKSLGYIYLYERTGN